MSQGSFDPRQMKVERYADFGTSEPWVARTMLGLGDIVGATKWSGDQDVADALGGVFEALGEAFNDLRALRELEAKPEVPVTDRNSAYSAFYTHLWRAYKDRFQKTLPVALGYKIGFLFGNDQDYETVSAKFLGKHPEVDPGVIEMMRDERVSWQNALSKFRNDHLEHRKPLDPGFVAPFYTLPVAELCFENVWQAIEDISAQLLAANLPAGVFLAEIPEAERDPTIPKRFGFHVSALQKPSSSS